MSTVLRTAIVDMVSDAEPVKRWKSRWLAVIDLKQPLPAKVWNQCVLGLRFMCEAINSDIESAEGSGADFLEGIRRIEAGEVDKIEADGNAWVAHITRQKVWFEGLYSQGVGGEVSFEQYKLAVQTYVQFLADPERKPIEVPFPDRSADKHFVLDDAIASERICAGEVELMSAAGRRVKEVVSGYHLESAANGNGRITPGASVTPIGSKGCYEAVVQIWSDVSKSWISKYIDTNFFPADWSPARAKFEVTKAFEAARPIPGQPAVVGISPSGIPIRFNWDAKHQRTTFYPLQD